jgi:hypothetical protein
MAKKTWPGRRASGKWPKVYDVCDLEALQRGHLLWELYVMLLLRVLPARARSDLGRA